MVQFKSDIIAWNFTIDILDNGFKSFFQMLDLNCAYVSNVTAVSTECSLIVVQQDSPVNFVIRHNIKVVSIVSFLSEFD